MVVNALLSSRWFYNTRSSFEVLCWTMDQAPLAWVACVALFVFIEKVAFCRCTLVLCTEYFLISELTCFNVLTMLT